MYVTNIESIPEEKLFKCNGIIGNWLIAAGLPLLNRTQDEFYFMKTSLLIERLKDLPFYYRIAFKMF